MMYMYLGSLSQPSHGATNLSSYSGCKSLTKAILLLEAIHSIGSMLERCFIYNLYKTTFTPIFKLSLHIAHTPTYTLFPAGGCFFQ
jgi:hypothetical protein